MLAVLIALRTVAAAPTEDELIVRSRYKPNFPYVADHSAPVRCVVKTFINPAGIPYAVERPDCPEPYASAAELAVLRWRWDPPRSGGQPIRAQTSLAFTFDATSGLDIPAQIPPPPAPKGDPVEATFDGARLALHNLLDVPLQVTSIEPVDAAGAPAPRLPGKLAPGERVELTLAGNLASESVIVRTSHGALVARSAPIEALGVSEGDIRVYSKVVDTLDRKDLASECAGLPRPMEVVPIRLSVGIDGRISGAKLLDTTLLSGRIEQCLLDTLRTVRFPVRPAAPVDVDYIFVLPLLRRM